MPQQQVFVVHGGTSWPTYDAYFAYLAQYPLERILEKSETKRWKERLPETLGEDYDILAPSMPSPQNATYAEWALWFEKFFSLLHDDLILVGHSLGATFLVKYLTTHDMPVRVGQLHLVAGAFEDTPEESLCDFAFGAAEGLRALEGKVGRIFIYHSRDDAVVPFHHGEQFAAALPHATFVTCDDHGHFLQENFPELITNITGV